LRYAELQRLVVTVMKGKDASGSRWAFARRTPTGLEGRWEKLMKGRLIQQISMTDVEGMRDLFCL
jgi:hypothetical protein